MGDGLQGTPARGAPRANLFIQGLLGLWVKVKDIF